MKKIIPVLLIVLFGCSPSAYKTISKDPPKDLQEKNWLAIRCKTEFPADSVIKEIKFVPVSDSSEFFKRKADSIEATRNKIVTEIDYRYRDTCTSAKDIYKQGHKEGERYGAAMAKIDAEYKLQRELSKKEAECNKAHSEAMTKLKEACSYDIGECETAKGLVQADLDEKVLIIAQKDGKIAKQRKVIWIESSILSLLLIAAIVYLYIRIKTNGIRSLLNK